MLRTFKFFSKRKLGAQNLPVARALGKLKVFNVCPNLLPFENVWNQTIWIKWTHLFRRSNSLEKFTVQHQNSPATNRFGEYLSGLNKRIKLVNSDRSGFLKMSKRLELKSSVCETGLMDCKPGTNWPGALSLQLIRTLWSGAGEPTGDSERSSIDSHYLAYSVFAQNDLNVPLWSCYCFMGRPARLTEARSPRPNGGSLF